METTKEDSKLYTIDEAAEYLGICRAHIYNLVRQGLPRYKINDYYVRFKEADLRRLKELRETLKRA